MLLSKTWNNFDLAKILEGVVIPLHCLSDKNMILYPVLYNNAFVYQEEVRSLCKYQ